jgi:nitrite reductase/ring-hydroxylating ferredoxin subunit
VGEAHALAPRSPSGAARLRRYALPAVDGALVDAENELLLVRWAGRVHAFSLSCPHRGATLRWQGNAAGVFCPKHKARFAPDGAHVGGRRTRALDRYPIRREGSLVVVELATPLKQDADAAAWAAAWIPVG